MPSRELPTIPLVDDDEDHVELTLRALRRQGNDGEFVTVGDGREALDYLFGEGVHEGRDTRRQPALVLLDMKMPRVGGLDVLARMRADDRTRRVPVVMLSSSTEPVDVARAYDLGANGYVRKPVDFSEFADAARELGSYWLDLNEAPPA